MDIPSRVQALEQDTDVQESALERLAVEMAGVRKVLTGILITLITTIIGGVVVSVVSGGRLG